MNALLHISVVGDVNRPEFQYSLSKVWRSAFVSQSLSVEDFLSQNASPDVVVLLQSYPGEYSDSNMGKIIQANPLAATILLTSSWGEGERRTGFPIRDAIRVAWYDFPFWFEIQKTLFSRGRLSQLSLPRCASDAQRSEMDSVFEFPVLKDCVFWILCDSALERETLSRFYSSLQATVWTGGMHSEFPSDGQLSAPTRIVVAPNCLSEDVERKVNQLKALFLSARLYVIVNQPRIEEIKALCKRGADEVISPAFYSYAAMQHQDNF